MSEQPFTTIGDEALEARIVAWVLGEASAFEVAEMERLCAERPELLIFQRRMKALHGLIGEAEIPRPDPAWKLPPAKRVGLLDAIDPSPALPDAFKETRVRHSAMRSILSIAACLMLTVIILGLTAPMAIRQRKKAEMSPARMMAMQREITALEEAEASDAVVAYEQKSLRTEIPAERIEGTPMPMVLPRQTPSTERARQNESLSKKEKGFLNSPITEAQPSASPSARDTLAQGGKGASAPEKLSEPSSSMSKVIATSGTETAIPVPDVDVTTPSLEFGDGKDFGQGWGNAGGGAARGFARTPGESSGTDSTRFAQSPGITNYFAEGQKSGQNDDSAKFKADETRDEESLKDSKSREYEYRVKDLAKNDRLSGLGGDASITLKGNLPKNGELDVLDSVGSASPAWDDLSELASRRKEGAVDKQKAEYGVADEHAKAAVDGSIVNEADPFTESEEKPSATTATNSGVIALGANSYEGLDKLRAAALTIEDDRKRELLKASDEEAIDNKEEAKKMAKPAEPKPDLNKLIEEIPASEEPYSTFSLNISDTSFRIAQAALAKGERPDPAGIKVEQFYNAVNYGDPAPAAGQPVACFIEQSAHPVIPGRNLVRVALKTAAAGRSTAQPLRLTLLVDQSGSMSRADRSAAMDAAMRSLGTLLTDKDLVTVIGFSRKSRLLADGMKGSEIAPQLGGLVNQASSEGGTNLEQAIKLAEEKALSHKLVGAQNRIVLFTDGAANLGDADPQRLAAKVEQLRQQGISFDIAGIAADDLNDELLAELARKGNGRYSVVGKGEEKDFAKQLAGAFRPAAENVKVQVHFNPERVARYKLIGFEKDRLKTEDFRNDAVDAAELAAEEAGVAIYQVEPIADGRGEIGEVSVRFRDTSSGEMVERMWTMTHNAASPAIDRAAPSMQLAVLATLAGEKLKGGPLADAIDFKQFADSQATVKQAFANDTRIADMLRMVDALK